MIMAFWPKKDRVEENAPQHKEEIRKTKDVAPIVDMLKPGTILQYNNDRQATYEILSLEDKLFKVKLTYSPPLSAKLGFLRSVVISEVIFYIDREGFEYYEDKKPRDRRTRLWVNPDQIKIGDIVSGDILSYHVSSVRKFQGRPCYSLVADDNYSRKERLYDKKTGLLLMEATYFSQQIQEARPNWNSHVREERLTYTNLGII
jgi:hypothetical protein